MTRPRLARRLPARSPFCLLDASARGVKLAQLCRLVLVFSPSDHKGRRMACSEFLRPSASDTEDSSVRYHAAESLGCGMTWKHRLGAFIPSWPRPSCRMMPLHV